MKVIVNGVELDKVEFSSIKLNKEASLQNSFTCNFSTSDFNYDIIAGQEVILKDDLDVILFGGVLTQPSKRILRDRVEYKLKSDGYKQILKRRVLQDVTYRNMMSGDIVRDIFDRYLKEGVFNSEGFIEGDIADGTLIEDIYFQATYIDELFSELADFTGYRYSIDENRALNFNATPNYLGIDEVLTDHPENHAEVFVAEDYPVFTEDTAELKTRSYVIGKKTGDSSPLGYAVNQSLEADLQGKVYGSGIFEKITSSPSIASDLEADTMAESEVQLYEVGSSEIKFVSYTPADINNVFAVDLSNINIDATFYIESLSIEFTGNKPIYRIRSKPFVASKQFASWTDKFKQMLNKSGDKADTFPKTLYYSNSEDESLSLGDTPFVWYEPLYTGVASNLDVGFTLKGTAIDDGFYSASIFITGIEIISFPFKVFAGEEFSHHINFPLKNLDSGTNYLEVKISSDGPQIDFISEEMQFWVTSIAFVTGTKATTPVIDVFDIVNLSNSFEITETIDFDITTP